VAHNRFHPSYNVLTLPSLVHGLGPLLESVVVIAIPVRILFQIGLMFFLGRVKGIGHEEYARVDFISCVIFDFPVLDEILQFVLDLESNLLLLLVTTKDDGRVLRTSIIALSIQGGGIVKEKKEPKEGFQGRRSRYGLVELHVQDFDVPSLPRTNLTIGRIRYGLRVGRHEADLRRFNDIRKLLLKVLDNELFRAPVTSCRSCARKKENE
jgi:hypothetical protein